MRGIRRVRRRPPPRARLPRRQLFAESEVLETRDSSSREHVGIVTTELRAYNQEDTKVLSLERTPRVLKRGYAQLSAATPTGWPEDVGTQPEDL